MFDKGLFIVRCFWGFLFILCVTCCERNRNVFVVEGFPCDYELRGVGIDSLNHYPGTYAISMAGDNFIGTRKAEHFFFVLDENFRLKTELASRGHGNGEFIAPIYCGQYIKEGKNDYIYLLERPSRKLYKVALDGSVRNQCVLEIPLSWDIEPAYLFKHGVDSCIGVNNLYDCNFFVGDLNLCEFEMQEPLYEFKGNEMEIYEVSQNTGAYSSDKSRVAIAYFNLPEIDFRSSDGRLIKSVFYERKMEPIEIDTDNPKIFFLQVASTSRYIYALYVGDNQLQEKGKCLVLVFDWDGAPVCRLQIDASISIAVDEKNWRIISINEDDSEFVASEYELPKKMR